MRERARKTEKKGSVEYIYIYMKAKGAFIKWEQNHQKMKGRKTEKKNELPVSLMRSGAANTPKENPPKKKKRLQRSPEPLDAISET
jgi:hypothetical protein